MREYRRRRTNYNYKKAARFLAYGVLATFGVAALTIIFNMALLIAAAVVYVDKDSRYIAGGDVMRALTLTQDGYVLDSEMEKEFEQKEQWAMLLDENGQMIWSIRKPEELEDKYSVSEIARMSKWYLKGYPVRMRVWDDRIMIVGMQKETMWKYTVEFSIPWMDFVKRVIWFFFLINVTWIVALAFVFTKRFTRNRERARIEWIAGISHDIRTPLSMVMGYADNLEHSEELSETARQEAAVIRHQSIVMKELVADLNLTSQLEYSMQTLRKEKVRPAEVIRSVSAAFLNDSLPGALELDVQIEPEAEPLCIKADRQLLVRVLRNLINNSIRHGGRDGTVEVGISMWEERGKCHICLRDNGAGYSEEALRRLRSRKKEPAGESIRGLEIVKKIVLAHGGKIQFGNEEKGGGYCLIVFCKNFRRDKQTDFPGQGK